MTAPADRGEDLRRIAAGLAAAGKVLEAFTPGAIEAERKKGGSPVTEADRQVDEALRAELPREGEGWLSEETVDDKTRLDHHRVWIVDPVDGTKEFVEGLPEWCVSVGLVEGGKAVAGGIYSPSADRLVLGSVETGVTLNGAPIDPIAATDLGGARVLASRSEMRRGEWEVFDGAGFQVEPMGSVAYKLALVAAGLVEATWTLVPKNEWDIAAGVALIEAAGGAVWRPDGEPITFNNESTLYPGLIACAGSLAPAVRQVIAERWQPEPAPS